MLRRALSYLYAKESKSSFAIEHIKPTATRTERFVSLLQTAEKDDFFQKPSLIGLQNAIVDERFADRDFRTTQNYVGESVSWQNERVHFVSPKPGDLAALMDGMFLSHERMNAQTIHPVVHAAAISYGFVFMHPFEDGNAKQAIGEIVDMPDRLIDLFIRFCLQNGGKLSKHKREEFFAVLSEQEVAKMEEAVQSAYQSISEGQQ